MDETFRCEKCGTEIPRPSPGDDAWRSVHYLLFNQFGLFGSGVRVVGHGMHVYPCDAHADELARWLRNQPEATIRERR